MPNNERMEPFQLMNIKAGQSIMLNWPLLKKITVFVDSRNLFNAKNVVWIDASARIGGELGDPGAYGVGRRTRVGLELVFE